MRSFRRSNRLNYSSTKTIPKKILGWNMSAFNIDHYSIYRTVKTQPTHVQEIESNDSDDGYTVLPSLSETAGSQYDSLCKIYEAFTKEFISARVNSDHFKLHLCMAEPLNTYIMLEFTNIPDSDLTKCIVSFMAEAEIYSSKEFLVQGEINDLVIRLLDLDVDLTTVNPAKYYEIGAVTCGILDMNTNLGFYKDAYLTLSNIPFLNNIKWPLKERCRIGSYYLEKNN